MGVFNTSNSVAAPQPTTQASYTVAQLQADAVNAANQYGVPAQLFLDQITAESSWNPNAVSSTGAVGLAQILPSTAAAPGYGVTPISDPGNPVAALTFAAQYDAALYNQTGSWQGALAAYSQGINKVLLGTATSPYPGKTAIATDLASLNGYGLTSGTSGLGSSGPGFTTYGSGSGIGGGGSGIGGTYGYSGGGYAASGLGSGASLGVGYADNPIMYDPTTGAIVANPAQTSVGNPGTAAGTVGKEVATIWNTLVKYFGSGVVIILGLILIGGGIFLFSRK